MASPISVILCNIRSAHNVGSIFRTADACGAVKIYLVGYTPTPTDRFGRSQPMIAKTALGAEKTVPWEAREDIGSLIAALKGEGMTVVALEQSPQSVDYKTFVPATPTALIVGNEVGGIPPSVLSRCDLVIEIPMRGNKESLNVSVAAGIALARLSGI